MFLKHGEDLGECVAYYKNSTQKTLESNVEWTYCKARDLEKLYPEDKVKIIVKNKTQKGLFITDPEFPKDEDERYYMVRGKVSFGKSLKQIEEYGIEGKVGVNEDVAKAIEDGGLLDSMPMIDGMSMAAHDTFFKEIDVDSPAFVPSVRIYGVMMHKARRVIIH